MKLRPIKPLPIDLAIAEVMWRGVSGRPCDWSDLDADEQKEWAAMARCARLFIVQNIDDGLGQIEITKGDSRELSRTLRSLARCAIRDTLKMKGTP